MRTCEQSRESSVSLAISTGNDTHRNPIRQDLNYNESAALTDVHVKRYKFRIEADVVATQSSIDWRISSATSQNQVPDAKEGASNQRKARGAGTGRMTPN